MPYKPAIWFVINSATMIKAGIAVASRDIANVTTFVPCPVVRDLATLLTGL